MKKPNAMKTISTIMMCLDGTICGSCMSYRKWFPFAIAVILGIMIIIYSYMVEYKGEQR